MSPPTSQNSTDITSLLATTWSSGRNVWHPFSHKRAQPVSLVSVIIGNGTSKVLNRSLTQLHAELLLVSLQTWYPASVSPKYYFKILKEEIKQCNTDSLPHLPTPFPAFLYCVSLLPQLCCCLLLGSGKSSD